MLERIDPSRQGGNLTYRNFSYEHTQRYEIAAAIIAAWKVGRVYKPIIADIACADGYGCRTLGKCGQYVGIDADPEALLQARRKYEYPQMYDFHFVDLNRHESFDILSSTVAPHVVVTLETAEHLIDPRRFFAEIHAILRDDGLLIASMPTDLTRDYLYYHLHDLSDGEWRKILADAGFQIESIIQMTFETPFWNFTRTMPTSLREKWDVVRFLLRRENRHYLRDRLRNWILRNRFRWQSTMFVCRKG